MRVRRAGSNVNLYKEGETVENASVIFPIRMTPKEKEAIQDRARLLKTNMTAMVREAIREYLSTQEVKPSKN